MDNSAFLQQIISSLTFIEAGVTDIIISVKDLASNCIYSSAAHAKLMQRTKSQIIGKIALPKKRGRYDPLQSIIEDREVMNTRQSAVFLKINQYKGQIQPLIMSKSPIINPYTNDVVGLFCYFKKIHAMNLSHEILKSFTSYKQKCNLVDSKLKLSKREKQVIFLFLARLSSQEIADLLGQMENKRISKSSIDSIFMDQLFIKFKVYNRVALYDKLIECGFDQLLPEEILTDASIRLKDMLTY